MNPWSGSPACGRAEDKSINESVSLNEWELSTVLSKSFSVAQSRVIYWPRWILINSKVSKFIAERRCIGLAKRECIAQLETIKCEVSDFPQNAQSAFKLNGKSIDCGVSDKIENRDDSMRRHAVMLSFTILPSHLFASPHFHFYLALLPSRWVESNKRRRNAATVARS